MALDEVEVLAEPEVVADELAPGRLPEEPEVLAEPELLEPELVVEPEVLAEPELVEPEVLAEPEVLEPEPTPPKAKRANLPEPELEDIENFLGGLD